MSLSQIFLSLHLGMILDVARHKFYEGLLLLLLFASAATVVVGLSYAFTEPAPVESLPLLGSLVQNFAAQHPLIATLLVLPLLVASALRLSRVTVRVSLYPQGTLAAIALAAITLFATIPADGFAVLLVVALLVANAIGRLLYCFGPNLRMHQLFTAMLALGTLPLIDGTLCILSAIFVLLTIILRGTLREISIILVAVSTPLFVCCYLVWLTGGDFLGPVAEVRTSLLAASLDDVVGYLTLPRLIFVGTLLFLQLSSTMLYFNNRVSLSGSVRNIWFLLQLSLLVILGAILGLGIASPALILALALVVLPMIPMFFVCSGQLTSVIIFLFYIATALVAVA